MRTLYPEPAQGTGTLQTTVCAGDGPGDAAGRDSGQRGALLWADAGEQRPAERAGLCAGPGDRGSRSLCRAAVQLWQQRGLRRGLQDPQSAAGGRPLPRGRPDDREGALLQRHHPALPQRPGRRPRYQPAGTPHPCTLCGSGPLYQPVRGDGHRNAAIHHPQPRQHPSDGLPPDKSGLQAVS